MNGQRLILVLDHNYCNYTCSVAGFVCSRSAHSSSRGGGGGGGGGGAMKNIFIKKRELLQ